MVVADDLALLFPVVLPNHAFSTKGDPLHKPIPRFGGVGRGIDGAPEFLVTDKVERLTQMRDERRRVGEPAFEVVACIDGRGFGVRRADMRNLLLITEGKVFTLATLDQLVPYTRLHEFLPVSPPEAQ